VCVDIRLAAGGIAPKPLLLHGVEALLIGTRLDAASLDRAAAAAMEIVDPPSDILGSSEYRRAMLGVLVKRAVRQCREQEGER
jgi:carbon-monoxide dehydrogenase medium subunit